MQNKRMPVGLYLCVLSCAACGNQDIASSRNELFENPFVAIGLNKTGTITGYLAGLRTAPERTDACKFFFSGTTQKSAETTISIRNAIVENGKIKNSFVSQGRLIASKGGVKLIIRKFALPGDCEWILSFVGDPAIAVQGETLNIGVDPSQKGSWIAVRVVSEKRAYFHSEPNESSRKKEFLVAGDLMYVYDEQPGWYFVKFKYKKIETLGWIKSKDVLQVN